MAKDKLEMAIEKVKDEHAENAFNEIVEASSEARKNSALVLIGAIGAFGSIAQFTTVAAIRGLEKLQEEKLYRELGFQTFDQFLNESEYSPITKNQFYDQRQILNREGDAVYELFNKLKLPLSKRKYLNSGSVQIEGDVLYIQTGEGDEAKEIEVSVEDRSMLLQVLSTIADQSNRQKTKTALLQEKIEGLEKELTSGGSAKQRNLDEISQLAQSAAGTLARLALALEETDEERRSAFYNSQLPAIAGSYQRVNDALADDDEL